MTAAGVAVAVPGNIGDGSLHRTLVENSGRLSGTGRGLA
jgi:hypothetical protein